MPVPGKNILVPVPVPVPVPAEKIYISNRPYSVPQLPKILPVPVPGKERIVPVPVPVPVPGGKPDKITKMSGYSYRMSYNM